MTNGNPLFRAEDIINHNASRAEAICEAWLQLAKAKPEVIHAARLAILTADEPLRFALEGRCCGDVNYAARCHIKVELYLEQPSRKERPNDAA